MFCSKAEKPLSQFDIFREHETSAPGYEPTTDEIIAAVENWDSEFGVVVSEVGSDRFTMQFQKLPADLDDLANALYVFCPNIIEQDFGCYPDILESADALPPEYIAFVREMSEGIDFTDEDFPFQLLKRSLLRSRQVTFMWD